MLAEDKLAESTYADVRFCFPLRRLENGFQFQFPIKALVSLVFFSSEQAIYVERGVQSSEPGK